MGSFFNPGKRLFADTRRSEIYIDKSEMIEYLNRCIDTEQRFVCVSRPRRFGKSMAAKMLCAYYDQSCDAQELFDGLKIAGAASYQTHLNRYPVIHLDIQWFRSNSQDGTAAVRMLEKGVSAELLAAYPEAAEEICADGEYVPLPVVLEQLSRRIGKRFVIIIDEWDCLFRQDKSDHKAQEAYLALLRGLFKGTVSEQFVSLAYLTGILPIKKYGTESALNNFDEYTMADPGPLAEYVGFTEEEVYALCAEYKMNFEEAQRWYDGYRFFENSHIYSPKSVVDAMRRHRFGNYWTKTETYESLKLYIAMNFDGLKDTVIDLLGGAHHRCDTEAFQNDMTTFESGDDVLTLLVHLGYLAYDVEQGEVFIPNEEVRSAFVRAIRVNGWNEVMQAIGDSERLLQATWAKDEETVAAMIHAVHRQNTASLVYNHEISLASVITLAYYSAAKDYTVIRELPAGEGFADIVFLPRRVSEKPALVVELKWNRSAEGAVRQIREKRYVEALREYRGNILLVGINYDKKTKTHQCRIEEALI